MRRSSQLNRLLVLVLVFKKIGTNTNTSSLFNWLERRMKISGVKLVQVGELDKEMPSERQTVAEAD